MLIPPQLFFHLFRIVIIHCKSTPMFRIQPIIHLQATSSANPNISSSNQFFILKLLQFPTLTFHLQTNPSFGTKLCAEIVISNLCFFTNFQVSSRFHVWKRRLTWVCSPKSCGNNKFRKDWLFNIQWKPLPKLYHNSNHNSHQPYIVFPWNLRHLLWYFLRTNWGRRDLNPRLLKL